MDVFDTSVIEYSASVRKGRQLGLGAVMDLAMIWGQELGVGELDVSILNEDGVGVTFHCEANLSLGNVDSISPGQVNARKFVSFQEFCYFYFS